MRRMPAMGLDALCVGAFVAAGRTSHAADPSGQSLIVVLAPFLIGLGAGWAVVLVAGARSDGWRAGATILLLTLAGGMALRALAFGGGVAWPFVTVAGIFLAATMFGWRAVAQYVRRRRAAVAPGAAA